MNLNIMTEQQAAQLRELVAVCSHIVITCHKSPDGDALGASLAWAEYLRREGKLPVIIVPDAYPDFLRWMPGTERIIRYDRKRNLADELLEKADLIFCMDYNSTSRVDEMQEALDKATAQRVLIDHHLDPQIDAVLSFSYPEMSSTSELVFRMVEQLGGFEGMTRKEAAAIYCGMMTDTGGFTYNSTRPEIFYIISLLLTKGIDKDKIYRNVYNNYSAWAIRLRGHLMSQCLTVMEEQHATYFTITRKDMKDYHFIKGDAEGLVNEPLRIKGIRLSISLREDDRRDNLIWVSLRSVDDFPCNKLAEQFFNGGGHLNASGGRLFCSMEEAECITQEAIRSFNG